MANDRFSVITLLAALPVRLVDISGLLLRQKLKHLDRMTVGLVLASAPAYSETFFENKIRGLETTGNKVILFVDSGAGAGGDCVGGFSWHGTSSVKVRSLAIAIIRLAVSPLRSLRLIKLNRKSGYTIKRNITGLLSSAHMLKFELDWLHFGFAATAIGRENVASVLGAKMAASVRGFDIAVYPLKHPGIYKLLWERLDKLHYISDDLYALALKHGLDPKVAHQKITPAIDAARFRREDPPHIADEVKLLSVARLHWKKGLEYTIAALGLLKANGIKFQFTVVGEGEERERLIFACHQLGIADRVAFVSRKTPAETERYYREADIYLQYSIQEGFCNSVLEAQAAGLLCIVSDAEGLSENVLHGETGWVVPKRCPGLLAGQIMAVLGLDASEQKRVSLFAASRVREQFDLEQQKGKFAEFYQ